MAGSSREGSKSSSEDCNLKNVLAKLSHHLSKFNKRKDSSRLCKTEQSKDRARWKDKNWINVPLWCEEEIMTNLLTQRLSDYEGNADWLLQMR